MVTVAIDNWWLVVTIGNCKISLTQIVKILSTGGGAVCFFAMVVVDIFEKLFMVDDNGSRMVLFCQCSA